MIDQIMLAICQKLGIDPIAMASLIPLVVIVCNMTGRAIPDTATGFLGVVRKVAKVIGLYVSNRIDSGVSVNTAARIVTGTPEPGTENVASNTQGVIPPTNFSKLSSHWLATAGALVMLLLLGGFLSGCATIGKGLDNVGNFVCTHQAAVRQSAMDAMTAAQSIQDPTRRALAIAAAQTMLNSVDACPMNAVQAPITTQPAAPAAVTGE